MTFRQRQFAGATDGAGELARNAVYPVTMIGMDTDLPRGYAGADRLHLWAKNPPGILGKRRAALHKETKGPVTPCAKRANVSKSSNKTEADWDRPDLSLSAVPRYVQLASLFRSRIASGDWKVGSQIPTVDDLVQQCGVARATIRQSLGLLEREGLIRRYRAKGTFVEKSPAEQLWCEVKTDWSGLLLSREGATIEVLHDEGDCEAPEIGDKFGVMAPKYRHLRRRHSRNGQPYLLANLYVDERLRKFIADDAYQNQPAMRLISNLDGVDIVDAHQTLTVGSADVETARMLEIPLNAPVVHVNRFAIDSDGFVVLVAKGIYRGDVVHLEMHLT